MRCQNCNKFTGLTFDDEPEFQDGPDIDEDGRITGSVRIVRATECCGDEAKEAIFDVEEEIDEVVANAHNGDGHQLSVECDHLDPVEEGGGRYAKSYFGASCSLEVRCSCQKEGDEALVVIEWSDKIPAGQMDEIL